MPIFNAVSLTREAIDQSTELLGHEENGIKSRTPYFDVLMTRVNREAQHVMEFGVAQGASLRVLAGYFPDRPVWGFDTFTGLPERWPCNERYSMPIGSFSTHGKIPPLPANAIAIRGLFKDTIPQWKALVEGNIAFLHIDCDLYSSTKTVLAGLNDRIMPGTVLAFDEVYGHMETTSYQYWEQGEWRALKEWLNICDRRVEPLARGKTMCIGFVVV